MPPKESIIMLKKVTRAIAGLAVAASIGAAAVVPNVGGSWPTVGGSWPTVVTQHLS
ncbi:hypothetical protein [Arsenicicoccus sp. oral taxon 190]|uniref:hypothetical protein n=1 Tax=Arsenicicoccus sp. oral taxon 190 TaxID=1658671 RepID=UPI0012E1F1C5|nr:hypothetical protein [Arsenicicoccus sp. oral taxon 190]